MFALCACLVYVVAAGMILTLPSDEMDLDALLPGFDDGSASSVMNGPTELDERVDFERRVVQSTLVAIGLATAAPLLAPGRWYRAALLLSLGAVGCFVLVGILRLGVVFLPTVVLLVIALETEGRAVATKGVPAT